MECEEVVLGLNILREQSTIIFWWEEPDISPQDLTVDIRQNVATSGNFY